ncbi:adhesin biosynthesis transcription regulatory family protein [Escherichia sp. E4702]|uniref:adhesin biosynthesis transcription regulatory family protein n=1 Tax=Escherichia sp. E4702 TaxID=2044465 RepID=UPI001F10F0C5|nr:adhesin biosynthesis transcription regulatory family protein [Escherichia sp. E4702]
MNTLFRGESVRGLMEGNSDSRFRHNIYSVLSKKNTVISMEEVSEDEFWCIIELSSIRSNKIIKALHEYMVLKHSRAVSCSNNGVSNGYFGSCLARIEYVIQVVSELFFYYNNATNKKHQVTTRSEQEDNMLCKTNAD